MLIPQICEREIINVAGIDRPLLMPAPDPEAGKISIELFITTALSFFHDRIIAWNGLDEPDVDYRVIWYTDPATAQVRLDGLVRVRRIVREAERAWRVADNNHPVGFASMSEAEQNTWLLPLICTFSPRFVDEPDPAEPFPQPSDYANATDPESPGLVGIADYYFMDRYPIRRPEQSILDDFGSCILTPEQRGAIRNASITDPIKTLRYFQLMREQINPGLTPRDPGWKDVGLWNQNAGAPFRPASPATPTSAMEPAPPPNATPNCGFLGEPSIGQLKLFPSRGEMRFAAWIALLEYVCAVSFFNQQNCPDDRLFNTLAPVMAEMEYFAALRATAIDHTALLNATIFVPPVPSLPQESMAPQIFLWQYPNPPSGVRNELWLCCLNRTPVTVSAAIVFPNINPFPGQTRALKERLLTVPEPRHMFGNPIRISASGGVGIKVNPYRMRLFKLVGV